MWCGGVACVGRGRLSAGVGGDVSWWSLAAASGLAEARVGCVPDLQPAEGGGVWWLVATLAHASPR